MNGSMNLSSWNDLGGITDDWGKVEKPNSAYQRPADPNHTSFSPVQLLGTLPQNVQAILKKSVEEPVRGDEYDRLRVFLDAIMQRGENPFPIVRLYKLYLGRGINAVMEQTITTHLDYYWRNWTLPQRSPSPSPEMEDVPITSDKHMMEQLDEPSLLPGVKMSVSGRLVANELTTRWMRTTGYVLSRKGRANQVPDLVEKLGNIFGKDAVVNAFNDATLERIRKAEQAFQQESNQTKEMGMKDPMLVMEDPLTQELKYLIKNFQIDMLPKPAMINNALTERAVAWIQNKLSKSVKSKLNPDAFVAMLLHLLGKNNMRLIFEPQFSAYIQQNMVDPTQLRGPTFTMNNINEWLQIGLTLPPISRPPGNLGGPPPWSQMRSVKNGATIMPNPWSNGGPQPAKQPFVNNPQQNGQNMQQFGISPQSNVISGSMGNSSGPMGVSGGAMPTFGGPMACAPPNANFGSGGPMNMNAYNNIGGGPMAVPGAMGMCGGRPMGMSGPGQMGMANFGPMRMGGPGPMGMGGPMGINGSAPNMGAMWMKRPNEGPFNNAIGQKRMRF